MPTATAFKIPKSDHVAADLLYTTRQQRLALQKQVDALQAQETLLSEHFINKLPKSEGTGVAGKVGRVQVMEKEVFQVDTENGGWDKLHKYILKTAPTNPGVWALLQKRLGTEAAKEMAEAGVKLPGVLKIKVPKISLTKVA